MPQKPQQKVKRWYLHCEPCGHKQIIEKFEESDLTEVKRVRVPGGAPRLDKEKKKAVSRPTMAQPRMFKCPSCGRGCACKDLPDVYVNAYKVIDENKRKEKEDLEKEKRAKDGLPVKREAFGGEDEEKKTEFTG
jgi:hypothetical protein